MLSAALRGNSKRRTRTMDEPSNVTQTDHERVAALVSVARGKLKPFASLAENRAASLQREQKIVNAAGFVDGIGILLFVSAHGTSSEPPAVSRASSQKLLRSAPDLLQGIQNAALNYAVIATLALTVFVTLGVLHAGGNAYGVSPEEVGLNLDPEHNGAHPFTDLATWAWPADALAQANLRRVLYCIECGLIAYGMMLCGICFFEALCLFIVTTTALPHVLEQLEFLVRSNHKLSTVYYTASGAFDMIILVMPFVAARASAAMFIAVSSGAVGFLAWGQYIMLPAGTFGKILRAQHQMAHRQFHGARSSPEDSATTLPSSGERTTQTQQLHPPRSVHEADGLARSDDRDPHGVRDRLRHLAELHTSGLLTTAVLEEKQRDILREL